MSADVFQAAALMRQQHGPDHPRHLFWNALADHIEIAAAWKDEGLGTCPDIHLTNYPDAVGDWFSHTLAVARAYLGRDT